MGISSRGRRKRKRRLGKITACLMQRQERLLAVLGLARLALKRREAILPVPLYYGYYLPRPALLWC